MPDLTHCVQRFATALSRYDIAYEVRPHSPLRALLASTQHTLPGKMRTVLRFYTHPPASAAYLSRLLPLGRQCHCNSSTGKSVSACAPTAGKAYWPAVRALLGHTCSPLKLGQCRCCTDQTAQALLSRLLLFETW